MEPKKLKTDEVDNVIGGASVDAKEDGSIVFHNTCKTCGKPWEYKVKNVDEPFPNWATGPWCPECRKKQSEEFFKKSEE